MPPKVSYKYNKTRFWRIKLITIHIKCPAFRMTHIFLLRREQNQNHRWQELIWRGFLLEFRLNRKLSVRLNPSIVLFPFIFVRSYNDRKDFRERGMVAISVDNHHYNYLEVMEARRVAERMDYYRSELELNSLSMEQSDETLMSFGFGVWVFL